MTNRQLCYGNFFLTKRSGLTFFRSQIQDFFFARVESVGPAVTSSANWYLSQDIQRPIMRCTPAPPPSPRRPPAPPSVLGISYLSFYRYRVKITNFLCSFMFWKTSAKRCENRRKPKARAKLEENQRRFYTVIVLEFRCIAVHATLSFLASFSFVFVHVLFLGLSSCLGDANKQ